MLIFYRFFSSYLLKFMTVSLKIPCWDRLYIALLAAAGLNIALLAAAGLNIALLAAAGLNIAPLAAAGTCTRNDVKWKVLRIECTQFYMKF